MTSVSESVLQQLPVFETIDGRWVKAESKHVRIYAAPSKHWETILREYTPTIPCLSSLGDATHVLTAANLTNVSEEQFLGACLAPWLMQHGQEAHEMVCVAFLEAVERCSRVDSIWKRKQERYPRAIITVLSEVPLVRCVDGKRRLLVPSDFDTAGGCYRLTCRRRWRRAARRRPPVRICRSHARGARAHFATGAASA